MNIEQLNCPLCKQQYHQGNPPRLLTMCGHTFCHKCIKTLITKKKDKGFKVRCPVDKGCMEMDKPNPSLFPKNIALIDLLNKTKGEVVQNQFLDVSIMQKSANTMGKESTQCQKIEKIEEICQQKNKNSQQKICQEHKKRLDLYCANDCQIICTDCALFGHHRQHEVKNLVDLAKIQDEKVYELTNIIKQKQLAENKFMNKQIEVEIFDLLDSKKMMIQKSITQTFSKLKNALSVKEAFLMEDLQSKVLLTAQKIRDQMKIEKKTIEVYKQWENQIMPLIKNNLDDLGNGLSQRLQNLIKTNFYEDLIKCGKQIILQISQQQSKFISHIELELDCLRLQLNINKIEQELDQAVILCENIVESQFESKFYLTKNQRISKESQNLLFQKQMTTHNLDQCTNQVNCEITKSFKEELKPKNLCNRKDEPMKRSNHLFKFDNGDEQESLLDFDMSFSPKTLGEKTSSCNNIPTPSMHPSSNPFSASKIGVLKPKKKSQLIRSVNFPQVLPKPRTLSVTLSSSSLRSSSQTQKSVVNKPRQIESVSKYQVLLNSIKNNKTDTVDLTGAELKNDQLQKILKAVSLSQSVKTLKLMRNKLDDSFIDKHFKDLLYVERINLAQNKFTQHAIDLVLYILKASPSHQIKSLNMGQNRIVQRKNRKILEQFKKHSINIML